MKTIMVQMSAHTALLAGRHLYHLSEIFDGDDKRYGELLMSIAMDISDTVANQLPPDEVEKAIKVADKLEHG